MSILTGAQIKEEIRAGLGNRTDLESRLNSFIDLSMLRMARKHDFESLYFKDSVDTVVTADAEADKVIQFPALTNARLKKIYSLRRYGGSVLAGKLKKVMPKKWDRTISEPEYYARGYPTHYTIWLSSEFELWRVPDDVYTIKIRGVRWPKAASVTGDGNAVDMADVDDLIINLSLSYAYHSLGRSDKAKDFFAIYADMARDAMIEDVTDLDQEMAGFSTSGFNASRGYDDPFVRSIAGDLGYD